MDRVRFRQFTASVNGQNVTFLWPERGQKTRGLPKEARVYGGGLAGEYLQEVRGVLCPQGITLLGKDDLGVTQDAGGYQFPLGFEGLILKTLPLNRYWYRDGEGHIQVERIGCLKHARVQELYRHALLEAMDHPTVVGAYVTGDKLMVVLDPEKRGWLWWLKANGMRFKSGAKGTKRAKAFLSTHLACAEFPEGEVKMHVVSGLEACLFDGMCVISEEFVSKVINEQRVEDDRRLRQLLRLQKARKVTIRVGVPGGKLLKALAYVVKKENMPGPKGTHVWTHQENLKKELEGGTTWTVMMTPKEDFKQAKTNAMTLVNLKKVFTWEVVKGLIEGHVREIRDRLLRGNTDTEEEVEEEREAMGDSWRESVHLQNRLNAIALHGLGLNFRHSRSLTEAVFNAWVGKVWDRGGEGDKLNVPIPGSRYAPVVPASAATFLGYTPGVKYGQVVYLEGHDLYAVHDGWWRDNVKNFGGCDVDDEFMVIHLASKKVLLVRMPNDIGEYGVCEEVGNPNIPLEGRLDLDLTGLPPQTTTLIKEGKLKVGEPTKAPPSEGEYTKEFVKEELLQALAGKNPGWVLNVKTLWNDMVERQMKELILSHEQVVDLFTTSTDPAELTRVQAHYEKVYDWLCAQADRRGDLQLVKARFKAERSQPQVGRGTLTKAYDLLKALTQRTLEEIRGGMKWESPPQLEGPWDLHPDTERGVEKVFEWVLRNQSRYLDEGRVQDFKRDLHEALTEDNPEPVETVRKFAFLLHRHRTKQDLPWKDFALTSDPVWPLYLESLSRKESV